MKEVEVRRYARLFDEPPFEYFIQSPVGLVPKADDQTRLIFHLSFDFSEEERSVNFYTLKELCSVKYQDLDFTVSNIMKLLEGNNSEVGTIVWFSSSDLRSAFRILPLKPGVWWVSVLKMVNPNTRKWCYFVDKCLPFRSSISCSHFQRFSNTLAHIWKYLMVVNSLNMYSPAVTNYLDDFLFVERSEEICNKLIDVFLEMCRTLSIPVAFNKTEWASTRIVFLGILLDGINHVLSVPVEKRDKAMKLLNNFVDKRKLQ